MARYNTLAYQLGGVPPSCLSGSQGRPYFVKPYSGTAGNSGKSPTVAMKTLQGAHDAATSGQNDVVYLLSESKTGSTTTDYYLAAAPLVWSNDCCHLIGQNSGVPQDCRSRVAWDAATSASSDKVLATFSGSNCRVENIEFITDVGDANLAFCVLVSGSRNYFKNCHFAGIAHATLDATGAYSLSVSGVQNVFENCTVGVVTIPRTGANNELLLSGSQNRFIDCTFLEYSETAGRCIVQTTATGGWNLFKGCTFIDQTVNLATGSTNVFDMPASGVTHMIFVQNCAVFGGGAAGIGSAWADTDTHIFVACGPTQGAAGGLSVAGA